MGRFVILVLGSWTCFTTCSSLFFHGFKYILVVASCILRLFRYRCKAWLATTSVHLDYAWLCLLDLKFDLCDGGSIRFKICTIQCLQTRDPNLNCSAEPIIGLSISAKHWIYWILNQIQMLNTWALNKHKLNYRRNYGS